MATAPHPFSEEEYREIFGSSDEENSNKSGGESSMESDIDFEGLASQSESESDEGSSNENDDETSWSQDLDDLVINNFASTSGIKVAVPNEANEKFFFNLIFHLSIINLVVRETNGYAWKKLANTRIRLDKWQDVTAQDLCAYFGMCIIMGINSLPKIPMYWSSDSFIGNSDIQNVMTKNRFEEISQYIHFNDSSQEPPRGVDNYDRLLKVCPILDNILEKIQNLFKRSKNLSIDEGMITFKGRLSFRQYMPAKLTKYGIKVWMAADSSNGYVSSFSVYLGQEGNEHRIHGLGYDVVMKMESPFLNKNRHIFFDNFFFRILSSLIVFLLRTLMHVEQFAATGKTYRRVQNKSSSKER
ncbi:piggyBac transposable element-derived protein 4-like [Montipora capricornis]|uniref:piggyBac transposable element-derived protein 4-like n=1 Tax=Montipora capricornis TaxID=246305 RepID=UPI0035F21A29